MNGSAHETPRGVMMLHRTTALAAALLAAFIATAPVSAAPPYTGGIVLIDAPQSGTTMLVDAWVSSQAPVVAYEYSIQNECKFPHRSGSSTQRDDIVYWTYELDGLPHAVLSVNLQTVPAGSSCTVFLAHGNVTVKGTAVRYTVQ